MKLLKLAIYFILVSLVFSKNMILKVQVYSTDLNNKVRYKILFFDNNEKIIVKNIKKFRNKEEVSRYSFSYKTEKLKEIIKELQNENLEDIYNSNLISEKCDLILLEEYKNLNKEEFEKFEFFNSKEYENAKKKQECKITYYEVEYNNTSFKLKKNINSYSNKSIKKLVEFITSNEMPIINFEDYN